MCSTTVHSEANKDILLENHQIKFRETVTASLSEANHDPEKFSNPHQFRLDRSKNDHIAFGTGIHLCLGAALARLESQLAFKELLTKYPRIRLSHRQPPIRRTLPFFSGFTSLVLVQPNAGADGALPPDGPRPDS